MEKPSERESSQWYFQRYAAHLPAAGEIVLFDRLLVQPGLRGTRHELRHPHRIPGDA
jgi:hypothetical protein